MLQLSADTIILVILLVAAVAFIIWTIGNGIPFTSRIAHWSATPSNLTIAGFVALVVFGFTASRARHPLLGSLAPGISDQPRKHESTT